MRIIKLLFMLLIMMAAAAFAVINAEVIHFNYYFGSTDVPLSMILLATLGIGVVLGILSGLGLIVSVKRENKELRRKSRLATEEINNLRTIPIKEK